MQLADYKKVRDILSKVNTHIIGNLAHQNYIYIINKKILYKKLQALKSILVSLGEMKEGRILEEYKALLQWNKKEKVIIWLRKWEMTY